MVSKDGPSQVSLASIRHSGGRADCAVRSGSILQERGRRQRASAVLASSTGSVGTDLTDAWVISNGPQPLEDLLGIGLLAERLEFFRKLWMATEGGIHGSIKLPAVLNPGLLELLELFH